MESGARALVTTHHTLSHSLALGESNNAQKWSVSVNALQINFSMYCICFRFSTKTVISDSYFILIENLKESSDNKQFPSSIKARLDLPTDYSKAQ